MQHPDGEMSSACDGKPLKSALRSLRCSLPCLSCASAVWPMKETPKGKEVDNLLNERDGLRHVLGADATTVAYEVAGATGHGATAVPIVCLHGSLSNRFAFRKVRPVLAGSGRGLVLTVLRGHDEPGTARPGEDLSGALAFPADSGVFPENYGLATTEVADLLAVLDNEELERVDVVAHSTGGAVAVALAVRHPQRVRRLVLIEPTLLPLLEGEMAERVGVDTAAIVAAAVGGEEIDALSRLLDFIGGTAWRASQESDRQRVLQSLSPLAPLVGPHVRALACLAVTAADVASLAAPTLLMYGEQSAYFEASIAARVAQIRPDLGQLHIAEAGHNAHLERPDVVGPAAAAFLDQ